VLCSFLSRAKVQPPCRFNILDCLAHPHFSRSSFRCLSPTALSVVEQGDNFFSLFAHCWLDALSNVPVEAPRLSPLLLPCCEFTLGQNPSPPLFYLVRAPAFFPWTAPFAFFLLPLISQFFFSTHLPPPFSPRSSGSEQHFRIKGPFVAGPLYRSLIMFSLHLFSPSVVLIFYFYSDVPPSASIFRQRWLYSGSAQPLLPSAELLRWSLNIYGTVPGTYETVQPIPQDFLPEFLSPLFPFRLVFGPPLTFLHPRSLPVG